MSRTYELVCLDLKLTLWVGQGWNGPGFAFYSGMPEVMEKLGRFLRVTYGHSLVMMETQEIANTFDDIVEFEPEDE